MALAPEIEELLSFLVSARLPDVAVDLRQFLEDGTATIAGDSKQDRDALADDRSRRRRSPEEQVNGAFDYLYHQLVLPAKLLEETEMIAGALNDEVDGYSRRRPVLVVDSRFSDDEPSQVLSERERHAIFHIGESLGIARERMLESVRGRDGE